MDPPLSIDCNHAGLPHASPIHPTQGPRSALPYMKGIGGAFTFMLGLGWHTDYFADPYAELC